MSSFRLAAPDGTPLPAASARPVPHPPAAPHAGRAPLIRTYSLSGPPGCGRVPDQREAGTARRRQRVPARRGPRRADRSTSPRRAGRSRCGEATTRSCWCRRASAPRRCSRCCTRWRTERSAREVWWLHSARNRAEHAFADESPRPARRGCRDAHAEFCYSQPDDRGSPRRGLHDPGPPLGRDARARSTSRRRGGVPLRTGRLHGPALGRSRRPRHRSPPGSSPSRSAPAPRSRPASSGRRRVRRRISRPARRARDRRCRSPRSNLTASWDAGYASLLEFAEACDVPVQWSCRTGVCHTCETPLLSGIRRLLAGAARPARRRQRARLLLPTARRRRPRPLSSGARRRARQPDCDESRTPGSASTFSRTSSPSTRIGTPLTIT